MKARWVGRRAYDEAHALQVSLRDLAITAGSGVTMLLLEHEPVITAGRRGPGDDLHVTEAELSARGIAWRACERGGQLTYHGPGQLVGYVIGPRRELAPDLPSYVWRLEETMIRALASCGVVAGRDAARRGVWVGAAKIGSVGVAVTRGVCWHGFAVNLDPDLGVFQLFRPCGLEVRVTSVAEVAGVAPAVKIFALEVASVAAQVFGEPVDFEDAMLPADLRNIHS